MGQGGLQGGAGPGVAEGAEALDAGEADPPVGVVGREAPFEDGDQGRYGLGGAQLGEQPDRQQGVAGPEFIGGEGGGGAGGARVAEPGQGVGGGDAALGVAVVEEQDEGLEGARVAGDAEGVGGDLAGPERPAGLGEDAVQLLGVAGQLPGVAGLREPAEWSRDFSGAILDLFAQSIDHRAEFRILGVFHESEPIRDPDHIFSTCRDWRARYPPVSLR